MIYSSLESMSYQLFKNNLGDQLRDIFQDLINYKEDSKLKSSIIDEDKFVLTVTNYFNKVTFPSIQKVLEKLNIILSVGNPTEFGSTSNSKILLGVFLDRDSSTDIIMKNYTKGFINADKSLSLLKDIISFNKQYNCVDIKTGKFKAPIRASLIFNLSLLLSFEESGTGIKNLTAEELAAILLHEVGHIYDVAFKFLNPLSNTYILNQMLVQFNSIKNKSKVLESNQKVLKEIITTSNSQIKSSQVLSDKIKNIVVNMNNKIAADLNTTLIKKIMNITLSLRSLQSKILFRFISFNLSLVNWLKNISNYFVGGIYSYLNVALQGEYFRSKGTFTESTLFQSEFNADSFVSLFGYDGSYISALDKIGIVYRYIGISNYKIFYSALSIPFLTRLVNLYSKIVIPMIMLTIPPFVLKDGLFDEHGNPKDRLENILRNSYSSLKNLDIPIDIKKKLITNIELARSNLAKSLIRKRFKYTQQIWDIIIGKKLFDFVLIELVDAKTLKELDNLLKQTDDLISNSLYYHAAKLSLL